MSRMKTLKSLLWGSACAALFASSASAETFNIPAGDLSAALDAYTAQTGISLVVSSEAVRGSHTRGAHGELTAAVALSRILSGTGFVERRAADGVVIVPEGENAQSAERARAAAPVQLASASSAAVETVVVTSSKIKGDIQTVPIAITALSQEQLTSRQIAGGPDLVKEVPNLTFTKTNFSGYSIQIRGIGTQAISVTTDPAVAVALNDIPFIRNHFFEQEFFDVNQVEVLRGPQGTLYGRNATAGVVNVISAKPTDQFEAMLSADWGNYTNRRYEGMVNIPIVDDRLDLRVAGEWTKRDGYTFNTTTHHSIDGRDLWSGRASLGWHPLKQLHADLVWEHFSEHDDRLRSSKQLCKNAPTPTSVGGVTVPPIPLTGSVFSISPLLSQGCLPTSLYSPDAFEVPNGFSLPYYSGPTFSGVLNGVDPYLNDRQSTNLRSIESQLTPTYRAKNDIVELNVSYDVIPTLNFVSQSGFSNDFLWSTEDYNRFAASPGLFIPGKGTNGSLTPNGIFCDPQLGCSDHLVAEDLNQEHSWQASQEFRLASNFSGPFNFSVGGNYLHYETVEDYYVFVNTLTAWAYANSFGVPGSTATHPQPVWTPGVTDESQCLPFDGGMLPGAGDAADDLISGGQCIYIDPNPIGHLNGKGHNYFRSQNPYTLNSYAAFGEVYYDILKNLKLTAGLRWTDDQKHFVDFPSQVVVSGWGYPATGVVDQQWGVMTGRTALNWTPKLAFTDQTLIYGSFAHGYKAGGANPPGAIFQTQTQIEIRNAVHPLTFKPEFIDAFELGSKNTLLDGSLTLNGSAFYYNYKNYQISEIVDRTAINSNFDAHVKGAEIEASWEPLPGLRFNASGGYEDARIAKGEKAVDLMDRTDSANHPDWFVMKPFPTQASNCIFPVSEVGWIVKYGILVQGGVLPNPATEACQYAYNVGVDPITGLTYVANPTVRNNGATTAPMLAGLAGYPGYDPASAPNDGQGFDKDLSGNQLPNAPHFTTSLSADYTIPLSENWAGTLHGDFYWQSQSFARVFNDRPYDKLRGYSNVNLALTLTSASGWQVMGYVKNVFDKTAITGDFLNSDDSGLTTNVFLTDPRLYGVRVTKNW